MVLKCCSVPNKPDGVYYISHPEKGMTKVFHAKCHKCKGAVLDLYFGLFANKAEPLTGKEAKEFIRKYPEPLFDEKKLKEEQKDNNNMVIDVSGSWVYGKTFCKKKKDGAIETIHKAYYFASGRLREVLT